MATQNWPSSPFNGLGTSLQHSGQTSCCRPSVSKPPPYVNTNERLSLMSTVPRSRSWSVLSQATTVNCQKRGPFLSSSSQVSSKPSVLSFSNVTYAGKTVPLTLPPSFPPLLLHPFQGLLLFFNSPFLASKTQSSVNSRNHNQAENNVIEECVDMEINESHYHECLFGDEEDNDSEEEGEWDTEGEDSEGAQSDEEEEDDWVEFKDSVTSLQPTCIAKCPVSPLFNHTSSFSSEESGFCDCAHSDWSDEEDSVDCNFDEGLWHKMQEQACFTGIPLKTGSTKKGDESCTEHSFCACNEKNGNGKSPPLKEETHGTALHRSIASSCANSSLTGNKHSTLHHINTNESVADKTGTNMTNNGRGRRKVTFKPETELVQIHYIVAWKYAYRACRKGPWEQYAADRDRFCKKIHVLEEIIRPCLMAKLSRCNEIVDPAKDY